MGGIVLFKGELAVSTTVSPNVCPLSWLTLIRGVSEPSGPLSHHVTYTLLFDAFISVRSDANPFDSLKLISLPKVFPPSCDALMNTSGVYVVSFKLPPVAITYTLSP